MSLNVVLLNVVYHIIYCKMGYECRSVRGIKMLWPWCDAFSLDAMLVGRSGENVHVGGVSMNVVVACTETEQ